MVDCHSQRAWARSERNREGGERTLIFDAIKRRSCIKALAGHWDAAWNSLPSPTLSHGMGEAIYRSITRDGFVFLPWPVARRRAEG